MDKQTDGWIIEKEERQGDKKEVPFLPGKKDPQGQSAGAYI